MKFFAIIVVAIVSMLVPVEVAGANRLQDKTHSVMLAMTLVLGSGALAMGALAALGVGGRGTFDGVSEVPWWAWLAGIMTAAIIAGQVFGLSRLGAGTMLAVTVFGQLFAGILMDHFALFGVARQPLNLARTGGVALFMAAIYLIQRS